MDVAFRRAFCLLASLVAVVASFPAADSVAQPPADKPAAEYADPKATYRTFIETVRQFDRKAAKQCWVIDDDNKSGALDIIVGLSISLRQINQVTEKKFGAEGLEKILKGWLRDDLTDAALDLTKTRLVDAEVNIVGDTAVLKIKWREDDGVPNPAFWFGKEPIRFRKVGGNWKIDANKMTGPKYGADTWVRVYRDPVAIMNEAIEGMEKGKLKTAKELGEFIDGKVAAMIKKREEDQKKEGPKGK
jgi:hypothetical protein